MTGARTKTRKRMFTLGGPVGLNVNSPLIKVIRKGQFKLVLYIKPAFAQRLPKVILKKPGWTGTIQRAKPTPTTSLFVEKTFSVVYFEGLEKQL